MRAVVVPVVVMLLCAPLGCEKFATAPAPPGPDADSCGGPDAISDAFDDGVLSPRMQLEPLEPPMAVEQNGVLSVVPAGAANGYAAVRSRFAVALRDNQATVEVPAVPAAEAGAAFLSLEQRDSFISTEYEAGNMVFRVQAQGQAEIQRELPYDPMLDRWWRIAEAGGEVSLQTSPDGVEWSTQLAAHTPAFAETVYLTLGATSDVGAAAQFDNLNIPAGGFCGISSLSEPFDAVELARWDYHEEACQRAPVPGVLDVTIPAGGSGQCFYSTRAAYRVRGSALTVRFDELPAADVPGEVSLRLTNGLAEAAEDIIRLSFRGGDAVMDSSLAGIDSSAERPLLPEQRFWRLREAEGRIFVEFSSDGATFEVFHDQASEADLEAMVVQIFLSVFEPAAGDVGLVLALNPG